MRVAGKDGDEGAFRKEHSNLQIEETRESFLFISSEKSGLSCSLMVKHMLNSANTLQ